MEPYVVRADRLLPPPEQWQYVKVPALVLQRANRNIIAPGYEMISNLNTSQTKVFVEELQLRQFASTYLWPMLPQSLPRMPIYTVVDINEQFGAALPIMTSSDTWEGDTIVATDVRPSPSSFNSNRDHGTTDMHQFHSSNDFNVEYGLGYADDMNAGSLLDPSDGTVEDDIRDLALRRTQVFIRDETIVRPLPDGFVVLASNGGPLAALVRAGEPSAGSERPSEERFAATLNYELNRYALMSFPKKLPEWFVRGMSSLFGSTQVSHNLIQFAKVREELAARSLPSLGALLAKTRAFTEEEQRAASLLVHFGLLGDNGKYAARFMQFVTGLPESTQPTEETFKNVFGMTIAKMETNLAVYSRDLGYFKSLDIKGIPAMPKPVYRDATQSEIARIKAQMYVSQANPGEALEELRIAYWRGEREPNMLALIAMLEQKIGSDLRARKILKALMELQVPPAQTYIVAARFQLADLLASKPADTKLTGEETASLIGTLSGALAGGLTTEDLCVTLAEIVTKSANRPDKNTAAFLAEAAKRYPKSQIIAHALKLSL